MIEADFPIWETNNPYPIYDESHREELNDKIIQHYYFREIGFETPALFTNRLNQRMREIMPYYNVLYENLIQDLSPFKIDEKNITETYTGDENVDETINTTSQNTNISTNKNTSEGTRTEDLSTNQTDTLTRTETGEDIKSDNPINTLNINDIDNTYYASESESNKFSRNDNGSTQKTSDNTITTNNSESGQGSVTSNGSIDQTTTRGNNENYTKTITGKDGNKYPVELYQQFLDSVQNVDMMIIEELNDLFMGLFNTTPYGGAIYYAN